MVGVDPMRRRDVHGQVVKINGPQLTALTRAVYGQQTWPGYHFVKITSSLGKLILKQNPLLI